MNRSPGFPGRIDLALLLIAALVATGLLNAACDSLEGGSAPQNTRSEPSAYPSATAVSTATAPGSQVIEVTPAFASTYPGSSGTPFDTALSAQATAERATALATAASNQPDGSATDLSIRATETRAAELSAQSSGPDSSAATRAAPTLMTNLDLMGYMGRGTSWATAVRGDYAYVGVDLQLMIIDISHPGETRRLGHVALPGPITALALIDNVAYVASGDGSGLFIVDVSRPATPSIVGTVAFPSEPLYSISTDGDYAYIMGNRLHIIDVSRPALPLVVGEYTFPVGKAGHSAVALGDGTLMATFRDLYGRSYGFQLMDISHPTTPAVAQSFSIDFPIQEALVVGEHVYLLIGVQGSPCQLAVGRIPPGGALPGEEKLMELNLLHGEQWRGQSMSVSGQHLFLLDPGDQESGGSLKVFDIVDSGLPQLVGRYQGMVDVQGKMVVAQTSATIATRAGLVLLDVSAPAAPAQAGFHPWSTLPDRGRDVAISGRYAYIADGWAGLIVVDISDPVDPTIVANHDTAGVAWGVAIQGTLAYIADEFNGLRVIDISDPLKPVEVGFFDLPGQVDFFHNVAVEGDYAYIADGGFDGESIGLRVVDISDPGRPAAASYLPLQIPAGTLLFSRIEDVVVADGYAYIAASGAGMRVVDVSDPVAPREIGSYETPGRADNLVVDGRYVYLVDGDLRIIDVADPASPALVGFYDVPDVVIGADGSPRPSPPSQPYVAVHGSHAYITGNDVTVLDVTDPGSPVTLKGGRGATGAPAVSGSITLAGDRVYVVGEGLFILHSQD